MPTHYAAPSRHTVLPYAATPRCSSGVCPRLPMATTSKPINHQEPCKRKPDPRRLREMRSGQTEPNPASRRRNRTESGSRAPKPNRIRLLDAGTEPNPPRARYRTESGPAMAGTEPNSNLGFANRTRGLACARTPRLRSCVCIPRRARGRLLRAHWAPAAAPRAMRAFRAPAFTPMSPPPAHVI